MKRHDLQETKKYKLPTSCHLFICLHCWWSHTWCRWILLLPCFVGNYIEQSCVYNGRNSVFNIKLLGQQTKNTKLDQRMLSRTSHIFLCGNLANLASAFSSSPWTKFASRLFVYTRSCCTQIRNSEDNSFAVVEFCCWKIVCPVSIDSSWYSTT